MALLAPRGFSTPSLPAQGGQRRFPLLNTERDIPLTPADVYFGRGQAILLERERIKRRTIQQRRLLHRQQAA